MHIPDNYLSPSTCAVFGAAMLPVWKNAAGKVKLEISKRKMPLLGIGAAFSFLIMMFNIPLPGGTTGHAIGGALLAILLGPYAACISVTIALLIQALLFGDGGILAFGANSFNMAFVMTFASYYIYKFLKKRLRSEKGEFIAIFIASYLALNLAALFTAVEFGIQPLLFRDSTGLPVYCPYGLNISIPAMLIPHLTVVGIVEGIVTAGVFGFIKKVSPDTIYDCEVAKSKHLFGFFAGLILLVPLGLLASGTAWGEWRAEEISSVATKGSKLGFVPRGMMEGFRFKSIINGYSIGGFPHAVGYMLSALTGAALLVILFKFLSSSKDSGNDSGVND